MTDFQAVFHERRTCFAGLLELSRRQPALIEQGDYSALLALLGRKQHLIDQLDRLAAAVPDVVTRWQSQKITLSDETRRVCDAELAAGEAVLQQILEIEQQSQQQLSERRDVVRHQLMGVASAGRAAAAYEETAARSTNRHMDFDQ